MLSPCKEKNPQQIYLLQQFIIILENQ